jgi:hypothetical protein
MANKATFRPSPRETPPQESAAGIEEVEDGHLEPAESEAANLAYNLQEDADDHVIMDVYVVKPLLRGDLKVLYPVGARVASIRLAPGWDLPTLGHHLRNDRLSETKPNP